MRLYLTAGIVLLTMTLPAHAQDIPLSKILVDKEGWRVIAKGISDTTLLEAEPAGTIAIFRRARLSARLDSNGKVEEATPPEGEKVNRNERVVSARAGDIYSIAWGGGWVDHIPRAGKHGMLKLPGLAAPNCLTLWPDEGHLVIGEVNGAYLWAVRIEKDGSFGPGDRYYSLRTKPNENLPVSAMTMDANFLLYAATPLGIQVFDPTGRLSGVIAAPAKETMTALTIGGAQADTLYVACGDSIYGRKIQGKAAYTLKKVK